MNNNDECKQSCGAKVIKELREKPASITVGQIVEGFKALGYDVNHNGGHYVVFAKGEFVHAAIPEHAMLTVGAGLLERAKKIVKIDAAYDGNDHNADECKGFAEWMAVPELGKFIDWVWQIKQERDALLAAQPAPVVPEKCADMNHHERYRAGWNACRAAMLAAAPAQGQQGDFGDAYQGAREDLAIWKRRALESEERVRQRDSIIDHLTLEAQGETRMGEPYIAQGQQVECQECERLRDLRDELLEALLRAQYIPLTGKPTHEQLVEFWEYEKTQGRGDADDQLFILSVIAKAQGGDV